MFILVLCCSISLKITLVSEWSFLLKHCYYYYLLFLFSNIHVNFAIYH